MDSEARCAGVLDAEILSGAMSAGLAGDSARRAAIRAAPTRENFKL